MAIIRVTVEPSVADYVRGGYDPMVATVDIALDSLTQEQRDTLAERVAAVQIKGHRKSVLVLRTRSQGGHWGNAPLRILAPTAEGVFAAIAADDTRAAAASEHRRAQAEKRRTEIHAQTVAVLQERRTRETFSEDGLRLVVPDWPRDADLEVVRSEEAKSWLQELEQENDRLVEVVRAEKAQGLDALRVFVRERGSVGCRGLLESGDAGWLSVAQGEFTAAHTPMGYESLPRLGDVLALSQPREQDLAALAEARKICAKDPACVEVDLVLIAVYHATTRADVAEWRFSGGPHRIIERQYPAIALTIRTPTKETRRVFREIGS